MYSSSDIAVTPRPEYPADGRKIPGIYTRPADLRARLEQRLGPFPLFRFWGPGADLASTQFIEASLDEADFSGADLRQALFDRAQARRAHFRDSRLDYALLTHAKIDGADFGGANLFWADFHASEGTLLNWNAARIEHVRPVDQERLAAEHWRAGEPPQWTS